MKTEYKTNGKYLMINVITQGLAFAIFVGCSFLDGDIANTEVKFFGPLPKFQVQRAGKFFGYRAEFEQNLMLSEQNFERIGYFYEHYQQAE